jgi:transposase
MAKELVSEKLCKTIEPLLPDEPPKPKDGSRPRVDDRPALAGIIFVLKKRAIPWEMLPQRRWVAAPPALPLLATLLREWQEESGVWERVCAQSPFGAPRRSRADRLGKSLFGFGEHSGKKGGEKTAKNPTDKQKAGSPSAILWSTGAAFRAA